MAKQTQTATFQVIDSLGKIQPKSYFTPYHADQMARALNMNEGTSFRMYYGRERFSVEAQ